MSHPLVARSPDLRRLCDDGYEIAIVGAHVIVRNVPYVTPARLVARCTLACSLCTSGENLLPPDGHTAYFSGEHPCHVDGRRMTEVVNSASPQQLETGLTVDFLLSNKPRNGPPTGYTSYYDKLTTYVTHISAPAASLEPGATARTHLPVATEDNDSVFRYMDTASGRAGIGGLNQRLAQQRVAIIGVGGTGSYVLDLVAKTPAAEIHVYDGDVLLTHNAFRTPGAASIEELNGRPRKVDYLFQTYDRMRRGIVVHGEYLSADNCSTLASMSFVFLCIDNGPSKQGLIDFLLNAQVAFVDVGMGIQLVDGALTGMLRVTACTPAKHDHVHEGRSIPRAAVNVDEAYDRNIQIAELNMLNAALAVIKWKKLCGFYVDLEREHDCCYTLNNNRLVNGERLA